LLRRVAFFLDGRSVIRAVVEPSQFFGGLPGLTERGRTLARGKVTMGSEWYVLRTKPNREEFVTNRLSSAADTEIFFPRLVESTRLRIRRSDRVAPMFPSYLFIKLDVGTKARAVRYTPGVKDFLRSEGAPEPVSENIISALRERVGPDGVYQPPPQRPERGARLRIEDGPLRGIDVIFEQELSGPERVAVLLAEVELQARVVLSATSLAMA
jgi:transcriptional antiterminator RfaH